MTSPRFPRRTDAAKCRVGPNKPSEMLATDCEHVEGQMETATIAAAAPQHMRALELANRVRLARAELKRRIATGEHSAAEVIVTCPWEATTMPVADLLMSQRRWGRTRCRKFLASIPISENKTIGSMTERQRNTLAALLTAKKIRPGSYEDVLVHQGGFARLAGAV